MHACCRETLWSSSLPEVSLSLDPELEPSSPAAPITPKMNACLSSNTNTKLTLKNKHLEWANSHKHRSCGSQGIWDGADASINMLRRRLDCACIQCWMCCWTWMLTEHFATRENANTTRKTIFAWSFARTPGAQLTHIKLEIYRYLAMVTASLLHHGTAKVQHAWESQCKELVCRLLDHRKRRSQAAMSNAKSNHNCIPLQITWCPCMACICINFHVTHLFSILECMHVTRPSASTC